MPTAVRKQLANTFPDFMFRKADGIIHTEYCGDVSKHA